MHSFVELAKQSVEEFIRSQKTVSPPDPLPRDMQEKAGVFVCVKKKGDLRGCIGTFMPCQENLALEIIRNAICAATQDPRFGPVMENELAELTYSVDVLSPPEKIKDLSELDPKIYGVIITSGQRKGLLLPDLEGVDTVEDQLRITRMKAGIMPDEKTEIFRFRVRRYK